MTTSLEIRQCLVIIVCFGLLNGVSRSLAKQSEIPKTFPGSLEYDNDKKPVKNSPDSLDATYLEPSKPFPNSLKSDEHNEGSKPSIDSLGYENHNEGSKPSFDLWDMKTTMKDLNHPLTLWDMKTEGSKPSFDSLGYENHNEGSKPSIDSLGYENYNEGSKPSIDSLGYENYNEGSKPSIDSLGHENHNEGSKPSIDSLGYENYNEGSKPSIDSLGYENHNEGSKPSFDSLGHENYNEGSKPSIDSLGYENYNKGSKPSIDSLGYENYNEGSKPSIDSLGYENYNEGSKPSIYTLGYENYNEGSKPSIDSLGNENHNEGSKPSIDSLGHENHNEGSKPSIYTLGYENYNEGSKPSIDSLGNENHNEGSKPSADILRYETHSENFKPSVDSLRSGKHHERHQPSINFLSPGSHYKKSDFSRSSQSLGQHYELSDSSRILHSFGNQQEPSEILRNLPSGKIDFDSRPICPETCVCKKNQEEAIDVVDCSDRGLRAIPLLPHSAREVYLQSNEISRVPCDSFRRLRKLEKLDLSQNRNLTLFNCSFSTLTSLQILRIAHCQLTTLSLGTFDHLGHLLELDLSNNIIKDAEPYLFTETENLERLDLSFNHLTKIRNNTFHGLRSLLVMSLRSNHLYYVHGTFEIGAFLGLSSLESLHLEGNQPTFPENFTYPDQALTHVPTLRQLWLDGHPRPLGPGFSSLLNLSLIDFSSASYCSLQSMSRDFFSSIATKQPLYLNLTFCSISAIHPDTFEFIPTITSLDLTGNEHLSIDGFENASRGLKNSSIAVLNISSITKAFSVCNLIKNTTFQYLTSTKLKVLVVEHCRLLRVDPKSILDLPQTLEYLSLHNNNLINAMALATMPHLSNLKVLKISRQLHFNAPKDFSFGRFDLSGQANRNASKPALSVGCRLGKRSTNRRPKTLGIVPLSPPFFTTRNTSGTSRIARSNEDSFCDSPVNTLKSAGNGSLNRLFPFPLPPKLEFMYVGDMNLGYNIPEVNFFNNKVLKYLDFSSNGMKCFGGPFYGLPSITYLDLSRNYCFKLSRFFFSQMPSLLVLKLYQNRLGRSLADDKGGITFSTLPLLEKLDLSNNVIEDLPELTFTNNRNLRAVNLSNNELRSFRPSLINNTKLEALDLSSNLLVGFSENMCRQFLDMKTNNANFTIRIEDNREFLCSCDNLFFLSFILENPAIFQNASDFQCRLDNGSSISYERLESFLPELTLQCVAQHIFIAVLVVFFLMTGALSGLALYNYKRWQWTYLYYIVKNRLHIGSTHITYRPVADAFVTYDQVGEKKIVMTQQYVLDLRLTTSCASRP